MSSAIAPGHRLSCMLLLPSFVSISSIQTFYHSWCHLPPFLVPSSKIILFVILSSISHAPILYHSVTLLSFHSLKLYHFSCFIPSSVLPISISNFHHPCCQLVKFNHPSCFISPCMISTSIMHVPISDFQPHSSIHDFVAYNTLQLYVCSPAMGGVRMRFEFLTTCLLGGSDRLTSPPDFTQEDPISLFLFCDVNFTFISVHYSK